MDQTRKLLPITVDQRRIALACLLHGYINTMRLHFLRCMTFVIDFVVYQLRRRSIVWYCYFVRYFFGSYAATSPGVKGKSGIFLKYSHTVELVLARGPWSKSVSTSIGLQTIFFSPKGLLIATYWGIMNHGYPSRRRLIQGVFFSVYPWGVAPNADSQIVKALIN